jgi:hypothetical protein
MARNVPGEHGETIDVVGSEEFGQVGPVGLEVWQGDMEDAGQAAKVQPRGSREDFNVVSFWRSHTG